MAYGEVGSGHQNPYRKTGVIFYNGVQFVTFSKARDPNQRITAQDAPCWQAGTPVEIPDGAHYNGEIDPAGITLVTAPAGNVEMLATKNARGEVVEYHPLIQFFNQVMADLWNDGKMNQLANLKDPDSALQVWNYLSEKYLKSTGTPEVAAL